MKWDYEREEKRSATTSRRVIGWQYRDEEGGDEGAGVEELLFFAQAWWRGFSTHNALKNKLVTCMFLDVEG